MMAGLHPPNINCCGMGIPAVGPTCNISVPTCPNPQNYFMWDAIHPTQVVYRYVADYLIRTVLPQFNRTA